MINNLIEAVESKHRRADVPDFHVGDTVDVHVRITEGDRRRVQVFSGTVIRRRGGGMNETFTVRRVVNEEGVERIFPLHCPSVEKVEVKRRGRVRRAKLYYLRQRKGKATKVKERRIVRTDRRQAGRRTTAEQTPAPSQDK